MQNHNSLCQSCDKSKVDYIQIEDVKSSFALCEQCLQKKDNKQKYLKIKEFQDKCKRKIKDDFPNFYKIYLLKKNIDQIKSWKTKMLPQLGDVLSFLENKNYSIQNFQILIKFFCEDGKKFEKLANQIIFFLYANQFNILNSVDQKQQGQNSQLKEKFSTYLQGFINKQFKIVMDYIEPSIMKIFSQIPENFQIYDQYFSEEDIKQEEGSKYFGYSNIIDQKNGKGVYLQKEIIYFGIFENDIFKYGVKFEFISKEEGEFFFGQFNQDVIENNGKMIAYKIQDQIMFQEYEGQYKDGLRNGKGKFIWNKNQKNEILYDGEWINDLQNGVGVIMKDGKQDFTSFEEGKMIPKITNKQNQNTFQQNQFQHFNPQFKQQTQEQEQIQQTSIQFFSQYQNKPLNEQPLSQIQQFQKDIRKTQFQDQNNISQNYQNNIVRNTNTNMNMNNTNNMNMNINYRNMNNTNANNTNLNNTFLNNTNANNTNLNNTNANNTNLNNTNANNTNLNNTNANNTNLNNTNANNTNLNNTNANNTNLNNTNLNNTNANNTNANMNNCYRNMNNINLNMNNNTNTNMSIQNNLNNQQSQLNQNQIFQKKYSFEKFNFTNNNFKSFQTPQPEKNQPQIGLQSQEFKTDQNQKEIKPPMQYGQFIPSKLNTQFGQFNPSKTNPQFNQGQQLQSTDIQQNQYKK
ncbi:unnamed protein product [Paramecium sonneborni]|uniref:MORN repeat protein n=1 Tax=Paramecium sonneborni TaxID=65129 RepID=A0A8S1RHD7_9CILI|nr:unnamed protein product [Paramecium sonneborni]